jgi:hypothetical protein
MIYLKLTVLNLATASRREIMITLTLEQLTYMINTAMSEARQGGASYQLEDVKNWANMIQQESQNAPSNVTDKG